MDKLTVKDIAKRYNVTTRTVKRWVKKVGQPLGQPYDKGGALSYDMSEVDLIIKAGGRSKTEVVDAELIEEGETVTLQGGGGLALHRQSIKRMTLSFDFDCGGASAQDSQALTNVSDAELNNLSIALGGALGESVVRGAFQKKAAMEANITSGMVSGAQTALSSQGVK